MILITNTFKKMINKIKSVNLDIIKIEISKHKSGLSNFKQIGILNERKILKGYLLAKKVRLLVLFQEKNGRYLPFYIIKKETRIGKNIRKESIELLKGKLDNIFQDLENNNYEIIKLD